MNLKVKNKDGRFKVILNKNKFKSELKSLIETDKKELLEINLKGLKLKFLFYSNEENSFDLSSSTTGEERINVKKTKEIIEWMDVVLSNYGKVNGITISLKIKKENNSSKNLKEYFVIRNNEGETIVYNLTKEGLIKLLTPEDEASTALFEKFLTEIEFRDTNYWGDNVLIIKGSVIDPSNGLK